MCPSLFVFFFVFGKAHIKRFLTHTHTHAHTYTHSRTMSEGESKQWKSILFVKCLSFVNVKRRSSVFCIHGYMGVWVLVWQTKPGWPKPSSLLSFQRHMALSLYAVIGTAMQSQFRNVLSSCRPALLRQSEKKQAFCWGFQSLGQYHGRKGRHPPHIVRHIFRAHCLCVLLLLPPPGHIEIWLLNIYLRQLVTFYSLYQKGGKERTCVMGFGALRFPRLLCHWNTKRIGQNFYHASLQYFHIHKLWHHFDSFPARISIPRRTQHV